MVGDGGGLGKTKAAAVLGFVDGGSDGGGGGGRRWR